ncbi:MAG TPA: hypothetical protein VJK08_00385, partial [Patescibacteria group bacterium]|nr:hypothetical protein [Patescibacteria group bacterium]
MAILAPRSLGVVGPSIKILFILIPKMVYLCLSVKQIPACRQAGVLELPFNDAPIKRKSVQ